MSYSHSWRSGLISDMDSVVMVLRVYVERVHHVRDTSPQICTMSFYVRGPH